MPYEKPSGPEVNLSREATALCTSNQKCVLISTPEEKAPLLKGHFLDAKGVASQEGCYCVDFSTYLLSLPHQVGLVVNVSTSHAVGHGFAPQPGYTKDHHKNGTNCLPALHACVRIGV